MNNQKELEKNILNIYGKEGQSWVDHLPSIINEISLHWNLKNIHPVSNMTFHYVAKAILNNQPVVLKIGYDKATIDFEKQALQYFNGIGSVKLIDEYSKYHALLLHQAQPGISLKSLYSSQTEFVMDRYVDVMKKLHSQSLPKQHHYRHIQEWLTAIDKIKLSKIPANLLEKAIYLKNKLLNSIEHEIFLHGDLHHDNIIQDKNEWVAIDPKGIVGDAEFEIAAFDFMYINDLANQVAARNIFLERINLLASKSNLNSDRIRDWVFVRLILMAAWLIEDNGDPSSAIKLAEKINNII